MHRVSRRISGGFLIVNQYRQFPQNFRQNLFTQTANKNGPATLPIQASHLIRQYHPGYGQTLGQQNFNSSLPIGPPHPVSRMHIAGRTWARRSLKR